MGPRTSPGFPEARLRGTRPVAGELEWRKRGELPPPIGSGTVERGATQHLALPFGEIGILDRQRDHSGGKPMAERGVEKIELASSTSSDQPSAAMW
jgi:hypothetical protein